MSNISKTVEPIKNLKDIEKIKRHLLKNKKYRDYMLFVSGINLGLRISDLLSLKVSDFFSCGKYKEEIDIIEQKTGKARKIKLNASVKECVALYLDSLKTFSENDYLFKSRKGNKAITKESAHRIISNVCLECGVKGNFGTHTLRKTFAYQLYIANAESPFILEYIMKLLNHSSQSITLRYLGLQDETLNDLVDNLNL